MAEQVKVVVDAMGGDNAPAEPVKAAVEAVTERQDIKVILTGKQDVIEGELAKYSRYPTEQIQIVPASEVTRQQNRLYLQSVRKRIPPL